MLHNFPVLYYLLASTLLYWLMLMYASLAHARGWTMPGMLLALGNRDKMPDRSAAVARADRAAKNMGENLLIFAVVALAAVSIGAPRADWPKSRPISATAGWIGDASASSASTIST